MRLPYPVHFVHGAFEREWLDIGSPAGRDVPLEDLASRLKLGREIWIVQAFHIMRARGHPVTLAGSLRSGVINVVHADDYPWGEEPWRVFVVAVRADRDPVFGAPLEVVQNEWSRWRSGDLFVPHWPQPGLLPRDAGRKARLETLVYKGKAENLASAFHSNAFHAELRDLGLRLVIDDRDWWDYRETDVVLAVRGGSSMYLNIKPASKLINAWMAECPAILSDEAGYREVRRSGLDYFPAESVHDVLQALRTLREQPELYSRMVQNGRQRARAFSVDAVAGRWEEVLAGPVAEKFERWCGAGLVARIGRPATHFVQCLRRRVWGYQAVQSKPSLLRSRMNALRRAIALPAAPRR